MQGRSWVGVAIVTQRLAQLLRSHGSPKVERATVMADRAAILQLPACGRPRRPASGGAAVAAGNGVVHAARQSPRWRMWVTPRKLRFSRPEPEKAPA